MTPRQVRRAAERKAKKQARKAANQLASPGVNSPLESGAPPIDSDADLRRGEACLASFASEFDEASTISPVQLAANRANAQLSTGPTSEIGKAKSSLNAVKTALTGRTVLLPTDDAAEYERHVRAYQEELRPVGQRECDLAQSLADLSWRLKRIPALEMAIFAQGRLDFADSFNQHDPSLRPGMMELQTFLKYEKQLRNLQLQEARLARRREKETAELRTLQQERNRKEAQDFDVAGKLYLAAKHDKKAFDPADIGFEFSIQDVESYLEGVRAANIARATLANVRDSALGRLKTRSQAA